MGKRGWACYTPICDICKDGRKFRDEESKHGIVSVLNAEAWEEIWFVYETASGHMVRYQLAALLVEFVASPKISGLSYIASFD